MSNIELCVFPLFVNEKKTNQNDSKWPNDNQWQNVVPFKDNEIWVNSCPTNTKGDIENLRTTCLLLS